MTRFTTLDLPNFTKAAVGFDRLFEEIDRQMSSQKTTTYPPYNVVEINQDEWMISVAVAGFGMNNLEITLDRNILTVDGKDAHVSEEVKYLYKVIANRSFRRQFTIADHVEVRNATLELGMLNIHLVRHVPEELQPKKIQIVDVSSSNLIEN